MWEIRKIFINQKGLIILEVILYISVSSALQYRYVIPTYSNYEEMYYKKFGGVITEELRGEMAKEYDRVYAGQKALYPSCSSVDQMKEKNKAYTDDYAGAIAQGYRRLYIGQARI